MRLKEIVSQTWKRQGLRGMIILYQLLYLITIGFFKGSTVTMLRDAPSSGLYYAFYEGTKGIIPVDIVSSPTVHIE